MPDIFDRGPCPFLHGLEFRACYSECHFGFCHCLSRIELLPVVHWMACSVHTGTICTWTRICDTHNLPDHFCRLISLVRFPWCLFRFDWIYRFNFGAKVTLFVCFSFLWFECKFWTDATFRPMRNFYTFSKSLFSQSIHSTWKKCHSSNRVIKWQQKSLNENKKHRRYWMLTEHQYHTVGRANKAI